MKLVDILAGFSTTQKELETFVKDKHNKANNLRNQLQEIELELERATKSLKAVNKIVGK